MASIWQAARSGGRPAEGDWRRALRRGIRRARPGARGAGAKHHRRRRRSPVSTWPRRRGCPACWRSSRRTTRRSCPAKRPATRPSRRPCCRTTRCLYNGQHVAVVVADTLDRALAAAARGARALPCGGAGHVDGCGAGPGLRAEAFPQRRASAGFTIAAIPAGAFETARSNSMPPTSRRSSTTTRWSRTPRSRAGTATG